MCRQTESCCCVDTEANDLVQDQYYTYTMFDVVGLWLTKHLIGEIGLPDHETMDKAGVNILLKNLNEKQLSEKKQLKKTRKLANYV